MVRVSQIKFKTLKVGRQLLFTIFRQKRTPLIKSSISYSNVLVCHIIPRVLGNFGLQLLLEHFPPFCLVNNGLDVMNVLKNRACFFFFGKRMFDISCPLNFWDAKLGLWITPPYQTTIEKNSLSQWMQVESADETPLLGCR